MRIATIGLDIAKNVFQVHCIDAAEASLSGSSYGGTRCWNSSKGLRRVWLVWRRAPLVITGRANS